MGKGSLIANEYPALTSQIRENLLSDLNERKIVKTISLKKVAVVAVASLGFGLLSVVPASAANFTTTITSINLTSATAAPKTNELVTINLGAVIPTQSIVNTESDEVRFQGALTTYPIGGSTSVAAAATIGGGGAATFGYGLTTGTVVTGGALDLNTTAGAAATLTITEVWVKGVPALEIL